MANIVASEPRTHALERRLRRRRQEARLRLRLVADCAVLQSHHASEVPQVPRGARSVDEDLRGALDKLRRELLELWAHFESLALLVSVGAAGATGAAGVDSYMGREDRDGPTGVAGRGDLEGARELPGDYVAKEDVIASVAKDAVTVSLDSLSSFSAVDVAAKDVVDESALGAVGAMAYEDVVMDPVVVAVEKSATVAAEDAVTNAVGDVLSARLAAGMSDSVAQAALNAWFACFVAGRASAEAFQDPEVAKSAVDLALESVEVDEGTKPDLVEKLLATVETMNAAVEYGAAFEAACGLGAESASLDVVAACDAELDAWLARFPKGPRLLPRSRRRPAVLLRPGHEPPSSFQGLC